MVLKESSQESPLMGAKEPISDIDVYNEELILTRAVLPITCETTETEAGMAANCVDTSGKLTAFM